MNNIRIRETKNKYTFSPSTENIVIRNLTNTKRYFTIKRENNKIEINFGSIETITLTLEDTNYLSSTVPNGLCQHNNIISILLE